MSDVAVISETLTGGERKHQTRQKVSRDMMDLMMARRVSVVLQRYYPGHSWRVEADTRKKMITVLNLGLSGQWGFVLHMTKIGSVSDLDKKVMRAGGELLERFGLSRLGFDPNEYALLGTNEIGQHEIQH